MEMFFFFFFNRKSLFIRQESNREFATSTIRFFFFFFFFVNRMEYSSSLIFLFQRYAKNCKTYIEKKNLFILKTKS